MQANSMSTEKGVSIFLDVFRRADKNDDGALSWDEFKSFFSDGVLSETELNKLFHEIDTHHTNNIDTGELCDYFSKHLGAYKGIFSALEDLNHSVTDALHASAKDYDTASLVEQFTSRFLLREVTNQLSAVQRPLDSAADALDERALAERGDQSAVAHSEPTGREPINIDAENIASVAKGSVIPGRIARRAKRQYSTQTSWSLGQGIGGAGLDQQVDRLRGLLDRLENKVNFNSVPEEEVIEEDKEDLITVVSRRMCIEDGHEKAFKSSLRNYVEAATQDSDCLSISVRSYRSSPAVGVYEVWRSHQDWLSFCGSPGSKTFRHSNIEHLSGPEQITSIKLPSSWWNDTD